MKSIVGLGNPGERYAFTPHNIGFSVVDEVAERLQCRWRRGVCFNARLAAAVHASHRVLLVQPLTFMNVSGEAVGPLMRYYRIAPADMVVILDDADRELGRLRIRGDGGSGGHKGLASVIQAVGTPAFVRVRIGVGRREDRDLVEHVLTPFSEDERDAVKQAVDRAAEAALCIVASGVDTAMNRYNT